MSATTTILCTGAGAVLVIALVCAWLWHRRARRRIVAALSSNQPAVRTAGVHLAQLHGVQRWAHVLVDTARREHDPNVLAALVSAALEDRRVSLDGRAMTEFSLWALQAQSAGAGVAEPPAPAAGTTQVSVAEVTPTVAPSVVPVADLPAAVAPAAEALVAEPPGAPARGVAAPTGEPVPSEAAPRPGTAPGVVAETGADREEGERRADPAGGIDLDERLVALRHRVARLRLASKATRDERDAAADGGPPSRALGGSDGDVGATAGPADEPPASGHDVDPPEQALPPSERRPALRLVGRGDEPDATGSVAAAAGPADPTAERGQGQAMSAPVSDAEAQPAQRRAAKQRVEPVQCGTRPEVDGEALWRWEDASIAPPVANMLEPLGTGDAGPALVRAAQAAETFFSGPEPVADPRWAS